MATKKLETLDEVKNWVFSMMAKDSKFIYRGQGNSSWNLSSTFSRSKKLTDPEEYSKNISYQDKFDYMKDYFIQKTEYLKEKMDIQQEKNLFLLAEMQHFSQHTPLIDFTENILVALWFAVSYLSENDFTNTKIFYIDCENKIFKDKLDFQNIIFNKENFFQLKTIDKFNRSIGQQSVFLWDNIDNSNLVKTVEIDEKISINILKWLDYKGINAFSIFPDKEGIYERFESVSDVSLIFEGFNLFFMQIYNKAILKFEKAVEINELIEKNSKYYKVFLYWGISLQKLGKNNKSIEKFKKSIELNSSNEETYLNLGLVLMKNNPEEAMDNFKKAIKINSFFLPAILHWGNSLLQIKAERKWDYSRLEKEIRQYELAIVYFRDIKDFLAFKSMLISLKKIE